MRKSQINLIKSKTKLLVCYLLNQYCATALYWSLLLHAHSLRSLHFAQSKQCKLTHGYSAIDSDLNELAGLCLAIKSLLSVTSLLV